MTEVKRISGGIVCSLPAKVAAFIMTLVFLAVTAAGIFGAVMMVDENIYSTPEETYRERQFGYFTEESSLNIMGFVSGSDFEAAERFCKNNDIASVQVTLTDTGEILWMYGKPAEGTKAYTHSWKLDESDVVYYDYDGGRPVQTEITLTEELTVSRYRVADMLIDLVYGLYFWIYLIIAAAFVAAIGCFVFLMRASGWHKGETVPVSGWGTRVPFDILLALWVASIVFLIAITNNIYDDVFTVVMGLLTVIYIGTTFLGLCMSISLRIKLGGWWKNTVIFLALNLITKAAVRVFGFLKKAVRAFAGLMKNIPLIWKTCVAIAAFSLFDIIIFAATCYEPDNMIIWKFIEWLIAVPIVLYIAVCLARLKQAGVRLSRGELGYKVSTDKMILDLKEHGEALNSIGKGMNLEVEKRLRSERMKTELITNVSHDIKTPLTSIINYSSLIYEEKSDNEKIAEYSGVLLRQSERLKRLIDDLVEASKATSGNLEMSMAPFDLGVLFTQASGEYEQKLSEHRLTMIVKKPEEQIKIMADGRRMWRIFDNLMGNICKYALDGTRVYLTLERINDMAVVSFKNTSREPLDIPAEELTERFTRGDSARTSEGNGLGLSIAKSLAELQNGKLEVTVDGDLFKAVLKFPLI